MTRFMTVDAALTNLSIAYKVEGLIADIIVPIIPVLKDSGKYWEWNKAEDFRNFDGQDLRAPGSISKTIDFGAATNTYSAEEYALNVAILWSEKRNTDSVLNLEISKTNRLKQSLMIAREQRVASIFTNLDNYASGNKVTLSGSAQWSHADYTGNIAKEIDAAKEVVRKKIGRRPNTIIIPEAVADVMKNNDSIIELMKYTKGDMLENGDLPKVIRGLKTVIAGGVSNIANEGASENIQDIWGKSVIICYINYANPTLDDISFLYAFRSEQLQVLKWDEERKKSDFLEMSYNEDIKLISNQAGYIINNAIA